MVSENVFRLNLLSNKFQAQGMAKEQVIIKPHAGFQEKFVRTNVDVCFAGGVLNPQPVDSRVATPTGSLGLET